MPRATPGPDGFSLPRRPLAVAGACCLLFTFLLGALLGPGDGPTALDVRAWELSNSGPLWRALNLLLFNRAWNAVGGLFTIGTPGAALGLGVGLAVVHWWRREVRVAVTCLLAPAASIALVGVVLKPLFDRTHRGGLVYPSTHAAATLAAGTLLVLLAYRSGGRRLALIAAALWSVVVAVVVLHVLNDRLHYLTDVLGGIGPGVGLTLLLAAGLLGRTGPDPPQDTGSAR